MWYPVGYPNRPNAFWPVQILGREKEERVVGRDGFRNVSGGTLLIMVAKIYFFS